MDERTEARRDSTAIPAGIPRHRRELKEAPLVQLAEPEGGERTELSGDLLGMLGKALGGAGGAGAGADVEMMREAVGALKGVIAYQRKEIEFWRGLCLDRMDAVAKESK